LSQRCTLALELFDAAFDKHCAIIVDRAGSARKQNPDAVHEMRVASRRLRAILRENSHVLSERERSRFGEMLKQITRDLGRARELDVTLRLLRGYRKLVKGNERDDLDGCLKVLKDARKGQRNRIRAAADLAESQEFRRGAAALRTSAGPSQNCHFMETARNLSRQFQELCSAFDAWRAHPDDEALHAIRIRAKKLRYACEIHELVFTPEFQEFTGQFKLLQDILGEWNDRRLLLQHLVDYAASSDDAEATDLSETNKRIDVEIQEALDRFRTESTRTLTHASATRLREVVDIPAMECCRGPN
jgi:CHAD domain-containing protein